MMKTLVASLVALSAVPAIAQSQNPQPMVLAEETILRVTGEANVRRPAEVGRFVLGVSATADTARAALDRTTAAFDPVLAVLRSADLGGGRLQTDELSVDATYSDDDEAKRTGFVARNRVSVTTSNLGELGDLLSELFAAGANDIDAVDFDVMRETRRSAEAEAKALAIADARLRAEIAASALGLQVSRVLLVEESGTTFGNARTIVVTGSRVRRTAIEPGDVEIDATYNVEFALTPR